MFPDLLNCFYPCKMSGMREFERRQEFVQDQRADNLLREYIQRVRSLGVENVHLQASANLIALGEKKPKQIPKKEDLVRGEFVLQGNAYVVSAKDGKSIKLSPVEYEVLQALMLREGEIVSNLAIYREVYGHSGTSLKSVEVHCRVNISRIRRKLLIGMQLSPIETVKGLGYKFVGSPDDKTLSRKD